ncbi:MAG: threonylcarbamoyl-AMP synthase [Planctomycetota bacterium]|nr:MAG: threonylcarbamoyl-AMP synthase [Planctomycetota bacterium]
MASPRGPVREIDAALARLAAGEPVAFPTETVYGLGARLDSERGIARVYELKARPRSHPLIAHLGAARELADYTREAPPLAWLLAERYWPGPLTLILRRSARVPDSVTGGQDTVGVRVPAHPLALELIARAGVPLAAPSANRFQQLSPTRAEHVRAAFGDEVCVLDGGASSGGIESTILDLSGAAPRLLRPGLVTREELELVCGPLASADASAPRASGSHPLHYAPRARVELVDASAWRHALEASRERAAALVPHELAAEVPAALASSVTVLPADLAAAARALYAALHELDARGYARIFVVLPPERALGAAIADRLRRAAGRGDAV